MRKTVFVHIGAPAAGAGFLQRQLRARREALRDAGLEVLDPWPDDNDQSQEAWDRVAAGVLASGCPSVVLSDEGLASAAADEVARGLASLAAHRVQLIYAMPSIGEALLAEWQHHVLETARVVLPSAWIDELVAGEHPDFWQKYDLADVFGRWTVPYGDVHLLVSPPGADDRGLWHRFAYVIGAPTDVVDGVPASGGRLGLEELELFRRVHEHWHDQGLGVFGPLHCELLVRSLLARRRDPRPLRLPAEHRSWIEKQAAAQSEFLAVSGFAVVGDLADLELIDERFDGDAAIPEDSRVLDSGIDAISELVDTLTSRLERRERDEADAVGTGASVPSPMRQLMRRARRIATNPRAAEHTIRRRVRAAFPSRGRRTYYLHIGAPKSGSSYLQSLLWRNRAALMRDGVYLPGRSQTDHFLAGTDFRERSYATQASGDRWRGAWDRLIDDAERSGCRRIVISSEFFSTAGADKVAAKLDRLADAEVQVVYAVRDFPGLLASEWQQGVKTAALPMWHQWLEDTARRGVTEGLWRRHDVGAVCERWSASAVDQVHVLVVPRPGGASDELWQLFQSIVGWTARTRLDASRSNESLGFSQAELLRRVQHRLTDVEPHHLRARVTKDVVADGVLAETKRLDSLLIPDDLRAWVESESEKQRQQILDARTHVVGDLEDLRVSDARFSPTPTHPSDAVMLDAATRVIARLTQGLALTRDTSISGAQPYAAGATPVHRLLLPADR